MAGSTAAPAFNYNQLNSELAALGSGVGPGGDPSSGPQIGQLLSTGNAQNPYAAYVGNVNGQNEYEVSVPGTNGLYSEDITGGPNGTTDVSAPVKGGNDSWAQFLTVAGIAAAPIFGGLSAAGEFGDAAAAGAASGSTAAGGLSADDSLAAIGNYGGDSVYGTSSAGGLADASGAGIPSTGLSSLGGGTSLSNLYSEISPYKNAAQGIQQVAGLMDGGQASTTGSPQGLSSYGLTGGSTGTTSDLSGLGGLLSLAGGIYGATQASGNAQAGINIADPNQANQAGYLSQLQNLVNNPSSINNNAEFQAANTSALNGVSAQMAAGGMNGSGNMASALYQTGLADQQNFYQQDLTNLEQLGGITQANQGTAAQIQQGIGSNVSSLLNGAGNGLSALLGNGSIGSALSSLGSGASSIYNSIFGTGTGEGSDVAGSAWSTGGAGGEGVTGSLVGWNGAKDSVLADTASTGSTDAVSDLDPFELYD